MKPKHFDICIIGGGAVGSSLALALSMCDFNVALIDEKAPKSRCDASKDNRVFALAAGSHFILDRLGVWQALKEKASPIHHLHASNKGSFGAVRMHAKDYDVDALGYMLASVDLQQALNDVVANTAITQYFPARFTGLSLVDEHQVMFEVDGRQETVTADLIIAADGARSTVREALGLSLTLKHFKQQAIVAKVKLAQDHEGIAYERFVQDGAIALLPYGDKECALIWSLGDEQAKHYLAMSESDFLRELQTVFGYRLGRLASISKPLSYPLIEVLSDTVVYQDKVVFVGNAAQSLHPIAAQGLNLALRNVALLVDCLVRTKQEGESLSDMLQVFVDDHKRDQNHTRSFTNALVQFFSDDGVTKYTSVRGAALMAFELCPPAKRYLLKGMMKGVEKLVRATS